jgi:hypothetical protein
MDNIKEEGAFTTDDWIAAKVEVFDHSAEFEAEIFPLLKQIEAICRRLNIPFHTRFFFEQSEHGNSSSTVSYLAGPGRATPEILALTLMSELGHDSPMQLAGLMMAASQKFGGEDDTPRILTM